MQFFCHDGEYSAMGTLVFNTPEESVKNLFHTPFGKLLGFPYFTNVVHILCSFSKCLHLSCSSIGTRFNGAETNGRIAHNLGILLMNSN